MPFDWWPPIPDGVTDEDYQILRRQQRCTHCAQRRLPNGNDPCLGTLPGVEFACCGHGQHDGYAKFKGKNRVIRGPFDHVDPLDPAWMPNMEKVFLG